MDKTLAPGLQGHAPAFHLPRALRPPLPLPVIQFFLDRIARDAAQRQAAIFGRLGECCNKVYLIDPTDLAFVLTLQLDPQNPRIIAHRRFSKPHHDARIAGTLANLMKLIDGTVDGDALFFSRTLVVEGDTAAVVVLRNTLDNMDGNFFEQAANSFGPLSPLARWALDKLRRISA